MRSKRLSPELSEKRTLMSSGRHFALPVLLVLVAAVCVRLGVWQLHRLGARRAANAIAASAAQLPVVDLDTASGAGLAHRRIRAQGRYDRSHEVVLRGVTRSDVPGVHVVTPLVLGGGRKAILVKRGFAPAADAVSARLDSLDEPGEVTVTGIAVPIETRGDSGRPLVHAGKTTFARLDRAALARRMPYELLDVFILQLPDSSLPSLPRRLEPAPLDDGPHLSYAIQWFAFATTALVVAGIFAFRSSASGRPAPRSSS